ncbi:unnamed protein product, partial [Laminaria digitata]
GIRAVNLLVVQRPATSPHAAAAGSSEALLLKRFLGTMCLGWQTVVQPDERALTGSAARVFEHGAHTFPLLNRRLRRLLCDRTGAAAISGGGSGGGGSGGGESSVAAVDGQSTDGLAPAAAAATAAAAAVVAAAAAFGACAWEEEAPQTQLNGGSDPVVVTASHIVYRGGGTGGGGGGGSIPGRDERANGSAGSWARP